MMQQSVKPETLQGKDLANVARATWREIKAQLPADDQTKNQLEAIFSELTFRVENNQQTHQQAIQGQRYNPQQASQGQVQPVGSSGSGGGSSYSSQ